MKTYKFHIALLFVSLMLSQSQAQWIEKGKWPYGACNSVIADSQYVYIGSGGMVTIWDRTDPFNPFKISEVATPDAVIDLVVSNSYLFVANRYLGFTIIDVNDPYNPFICARSEVVPYATNLFVRDSLAYIACPDGLWIFNVSDPTDPSIVGEILEIGLRDIYVTGNYAYTTEHGITIIDISNPLSPSKISDCTIGTMECIDIYVHNDYAYLTEDNHGLHIFDVHDPENPVYVRNLFNGSWVWDIWGIDDLIFIPMDATDGINLRILDISDPDNITDVGSLADIPTDWEQLYVYDDYAFWTSTYSGVRVIDVSNPSNPIKIHSIPTTGPCYDIMIQDNLAYVVNNDLYIVDISDPSNPKKLGSYITPFYEDGSAVYVSGNYAYMSGHEGLRIFDASEPTNPILLSSILDMKGDLPGGGLSASGKYVYWLSKNGGFIIVDVTQPSSPSVISQFGGGRNAYVLDKYAYCAFGGNEIEAYRALEIFDISDPINPLQVGNLDMPELVEDNIALLVQENRAYLGSKDNVIILDVSDPENPSRINSFKVHYVFQISVSDNIMYTAAYNGGVFIYDISDPQNPTCIDTLGYDSFVCQNVLVVDNMMYVCDYNFGLHIFENPSIQVGVKQPMVVNKSFRLYQNFPNPFNSSTTVQYELLRSGEVELSLYNHLGQKVRTVFKGFQTTGLNKIEFQAKDLPSGVYVYQIKSGSFAEMRKFLFLK